MLLYLEPICCFRQHAIPVQLQTTQWWGYLSQNNCNSHHLIQPQCVCAEVARIEEGPSVHKTSLSPGKSNLCCIAQVSSNLLSPLRLNLSVWATILTSHTWLAQYSQLLCTYMSRYKLAVAWPSCWTAVGGCACCNFTSGQKKVIPLFHFSPIISYSSFHGLPYYVLIPYLCQMWKK